MLRILVAGTGTEVGKTHAAVAMVRALAAEGWLVCGLKPIESGVTGEPADWAALAAAGLFHVKHPPYAFRDPISPHLAARNEGRTIRLDTVRAWVDQHQGAAIAVIETAGGLLSPLGKTTTNLDLVERLAPDAVVLVASDRLGVLHDVRACTLVLRARLPRCRVTVVLQAPPAPDASTGTNAAELRFLRIARDVVPFPRDDPSSAPVLHAARTLLRGLGLGPRPA